MTDARLRLFWHRAGPLTAVAAVAAIAAAQGCGPSGTGGAGGATSSSSHSGTTTSTTGSGGMTTTSTTSSTGTGGGTGGSLPVGLVTAADAHTALDATPDPTGKTIYFISVDPATSIAGVYSAPADGSSTAGTAVAVADGNGVPFFAAPFGIAISTDGKTLYVSDPGAVDSVSTKDLGVIFSFAAAGGTPAALSGSELYNPRSLEVASEGGADVIYYTGADKATGVAGVFKIPAAGGASTLFNKSGIAFVDPSGIAVAADGTVFVADTIGAASGTANIVKVDKTGVASAFLSDLPVGYPCGVALSKDDKTLYVSALDPAKLTDQLLQIDVSTATPGAPFTMGINGFTESAGLHRAKGVDVFAWADTSAGPNGGSVFRVILK